MKHRKIKKLHNHRPHTAPRPIDPKTLTREFCFDDRFPSEYNSLFVCGDRLFLADTEGANDIWRSPFRLPFSEAVASDFHEISLKQALEWYVRCDPWSHSSEGTVSLLCKLAAERLKD